MKRNLSTILMLLACVITAMAEQVHFTVRGTAPAGMKTVTVVNLNTNEKLADVPVTDGKFTYTNTLEENTFLMLVNKEMKKYCTFVSDGSTILADMGEETAMGTMMTNKIAAYLKESKAYSDTYDRIKTAIDSIKDTTKVNQLKMVRKGTKKMEHQQIIKTIEDNKDNLLPAYILGMGDDALTFDDMVKYTSTNDAYNQHPLVQAMKKYMEEEKKQRAMIGQNLKDFTIVDAQGAKHQLSEFIGKSKYTLVDFWASWCGPCMKEMPNVKDNYKAYHDKGFNVIGISLDSKKDAWQNALKTKSLNWQQFCDFTGWKNEGVALYGIQGIPWNFLCDSTGKILDISLRDAALGDKLEELFGE